MVDFLTKRDGWWHDARRVPADLVSLDARVIVRQSTEVRVADDPKGAAAAKVAWRIKAATEAYWRSFAAGQTADAAEIYEDARRRARQFGFDYVPVDRLAARPMAELLERLRALEDSDSTADGASAPALLGREKPPALMLSGLSDAFERLVKASNKDLSPDQQRKWKNPKIRPIANLVEAIGDKRAARTGFSATMAEDRRSFEMSRESVRSFLAEHAPDLVIIDHGRSTATVAEAASTLNVVPARIAKTLSPRAPGGVVLIVARGDARLDNAKMKSALDGRARMLGPDEVSSLTGHPVGGVCLFGLATSLPVLCDVSLREFATVFPAAGSQTSSIELPPERLATLVGARWVDVCSPTLRDG